MSGEFNSLSEAVAFAKQHNGKWNDVEITAHLKREDIVYGSDKCHMMIDALERSLKQSAASHGPPIDIPSGNDQRAGTDLGEELQQHGMGGLAVQDDHALDAALDRLDAGLDLGDHAAGDRAVLDQRMRLRRPTVP